MNEIISSVDQQFIENIIRTYPVLAEEEEKELFAKYRAGDKEAGDRIILSHYRLPMKLGWKYANGNRDRAFSLAETGSIGLNVALERYDPEKKARFAGYAQYWVRKYIQKAIAKERRDAKHYASEVSVENLAKAAKQENLRSAIKLYGYVLNEQELHVLKKHSEGYKFIEIAEQMNLTKGRVSQIKSSALHKISEEAEKDRN